MEMKNFIIFVLWFLLMAAEAAVLMGKIPFPTQLLWTLPVGNLITLVAIGVSFGRSEWWGVDEDHWALGVLYIFCAAFQGLTIFEAAHAGAPEELPITGEGLIIWVAPLGVLSAIAMLFSFIAWMVADIAHACKEKRGKLLFC